MAGRITGQGSKWIRPVKRLAIYHRDGLACIYCGATMEEGARLTLDHVVACDLGGGNSESNLVTACLSCNSTKQAKTLKQFLVILADKGVNPAGIAAKVRKQTGKDLAPFLVIAKAIEASREVADE